MIVPATLAEWLRAAELVEVVADAAIRAGWGDLAPSGSASSPLALRADAAAEARRQAAFWARPIAVETVELAGRHAGLVGAARRIQADAPGYEAQPVVLVIGAEERDGGSTLLTVLRQVTPA